MVSQAPTKAAARSGLRRKPERNLKTESTAGHLLMSRMVSLSQPPQVFENREEAPTCVGHGMGVWNVATRNMQGRPRGFHESRTHQVQESRSPVHSPHEPGWAPGRAGQLVVGSLTASRAELS
jgi:hypothetical protein